MMDLVKNMFLILKPQKKQYGTAQVVEQLVEKIRLSNPLHGSEDKEEEEPTPEFTSLCTFSLSSLS